MNYYSRLARAHNERISILSFVHCTRFLALSSNNTVDEEQFNADSGELLPMQSIEMGYFCESSFVSWRIYSKIVDYR